MADRSAIAWTDSTFNPWMGCTKVSEGCKYCYAEALMDQRWAKTEWGPQGTRIKTSVPYWRKPLSWNKQEFVECSVCGWRGVYGDEDSCAHAYKGSLRLARRRVFCASLADVFEDNKQVVNWRGELFNLIDQTPNLDWLLLTKRIEKAHSLGTDAVGEIFALWLDRHPNVWMGTSVENQDYLLKRLLALVDVGAAVNFLSVEPMIGPVRLPHNGPIPWINRLHWVIAGGESGANCRPSELEWYRDLRDDCRAGGVKFFMKQLGGHPNKRDKIKDFPEDLQIREFPE